MEQIQNSISKKLPPVRLYIDDVRELHDFVRETAKEVTLNTSGYRLDNSEELRDVPTPHIHNLDISAYRPHIQVRLTEVSADIYIGNGDVQAEGIAARIESILLKARVKVYFLPMGFLSGFVASLPFCVGVFLMNLVIAATGAALILAYAIIGTIDFRFRTRSYCTIVPVARKDEANFWKRNKDQIFLLLIGAIIGSIVTIVVKAIANLM